MLNTWTEQRHRFLIEANAALLRQAIRLLEGMNDAQYVQSPAVLQGQRFGSHMRHVLEFYECFLAGLRTRLVDYDARRRDSEVETSRTAAMARLRKLLFDLTGTGAAMNDSIVFVQVEDAEGAGLTHRSVVSSVGRELQALSSHTIHHFGLMAIIARLLEIPVDHDFGYAPSTLRFRANHRDEAA